MILFMSQILKLEVGLFLWYFDVVHGKNGILLLLRAHVLLMLFDSPLVTFSRICYRVNQFVWSASFALLWHIFGVVNKYYMHSEWEDATLNSEYPTIFLSNKWNMQTPKILLLVIFNGRKLLFEVIGFCCIRVFKSTAASNLFDKEVWVILQTLYSTL